MSDNNGLSERLPPYNRDAERSVLGSMLRDHETIDDVVTIVQIEHFYTDAHQKIFEAIYTLNEKSPRGVDLVTLADYLAQQKQIDDVGGYKYLAELWDAAPTASNARHYAEIVRGKGMVRGLIHASTEILRDAYDQATEPDLLVAEAEKKILDIAERGLAKTTYSLHEVLRDTYDLIDERVQKGGTDQVTGLATGFVDLDDKMSGFQKSELTILAARPAVGKTAFAINVIRHIAVQEGKGVYFVSLEMSATELVERLLACQARVDSHKMRKGQLSADDMDKLVDAGGVLRKAKVFIDDSASQTMLRIAATARRLKRREDIKLVVIDYLQLIEPENRRDSRQEQVAQISRRLKALAKDLDCPVMALAQVNRASEDRQDHRPRLADLRESGSIEQDADAVLILHRPELYEPGQHEGTIEVIIAKNRHGPTGEVTLTFLKQYMRYENFAVGIPFES